MNNNKSDISGEELLLIRMCRLEFNSKQVGIIKKLASDIKDWNYLAELANSHGIAALIYHNLEKFGLIKHLPSKESDFLRNARMMSITRNVNHYSELTKVLKLLNEAGIKTVLLKGMALEILVYGNSGLRQMTDVDVLISREECLEARDLLIRNGFTSLPLKSRIHKPVLTYIGKHLPSLIKNGFSFEIHHELFGVGKSNLTKMLYDESTENQVNEGKIFIPKPQLFFLYLIKHLFLHEKNNESQLRLYTDLVILIERFGEQIINTDLILLSKEAGVYNTLLYKLEIIRDLWKLKLPGWLNKIIDREHDPGTRDKFIFFLRNPKNNPVTDKTWLYRNNLREIPGIHRKLLYILGDLFPSINWMKKRYNCRSTLKVLFYYPYRLGKLWYLIKLCLPTP